MEAWPGQKGELKAVGREKENNRNKNKAHHNPFCRSQDTSMAGVAQWVMDMTGCGGKRGHDTISPNDLGGLTGMKAFEKKMQDAGLSKAAIDAFKHNYESLKAGASGTVSMSFFQRCITTYLYT